MQVSRTMPVAPAEEPEPFELLRRLIHAIAEVGYRYTLEAASRWSGPRGVA